MEKQAINLFKKWSTPKVKSAYVSIGDNYRVKVVRKGRKVEVQK